MNFQELYNNNRTAVERVLTALWCGEANNDSQREYIRQMKGIVRELFAPEQAVPVVQCMNMYETVHTVSEEEAKRIVGNLWTSSYPPYEHQYQCWNTLLNQKTADGRHKSIVVTTGTGSGKTECFMLPLVHDLIQTAKANEIQAIFLYPLNALMEDQKERLEALLKGTGLTYTVYNGDLPEREPSPKDTSADANRIRRRIEMLRGATYDEHGKVVAYKFEKLLYTREMVRRTPPNILLTNPTMLEYILLRGSDYKLIQPGSKSLRWVAIDETHTYTGAGAAELAMLLRRVLLAFHVNAQEVRFATSSATFGNAVTPEQKTAEETKLRSFISGITGAAEDQIAVVGGKRIGEVAISENEFAEKWRTVCRKEYVSLDELFPDEACISEKLGKLEEMCQLEDSLGKSDIEKMKTKVHYFYRVPNNGLYVRLDEHKDGAFTIYHQNSLRMADEAAVPMLELCRCRNCGEYIAIARYDTQSHAYTSVMGDDRDMFDIVEDSVPRNANRLALIALSREGTAWGDNNVVMEVNGNRLEPATSLSANPDGWHIVVNTQYCCPYCNAKQSSKRDEDEKEPDLQQNPDRFHLQRFRVSSELISRYLAPSILDQLEKAESNPKGKVILHDGQQYISFVDSRQNAAKATLNQNLEQERMWVYSTIFHELCRRKAEEASVREKIVSLRKQQDAEGITDEEADDIYEQIRTLKKRLKDGMTWMEIATLLKNDKYCPVFCENFIKRTSDSEELTENGDIAPLMMEKYVQSIMVMYLARRPVASTAPETLGLFHATYPKLQELKELPEAVTKFNESLTDDDRKISLSDWRNLLQVFLDYTVRSNQSVFLRIADDNPIDIFSTIRFATEMPHRRPAEKPHLEPSSSKFSRTTWYLGALLATDNTTAGVQEAIRSHAELVNSVLEALWKDLTQTTQLLEWGSHWDVGERHFIQDNWKNGMPEPYRMNLVKVSFKLYSDVYLCDVSRAGENTRISTLRPIGNHFKMFSPYPPNSLERLDENLHEIWEPYPCYNGNGGRPTLEMLRTWAREKRSLLWEHGLWGEQGTFMNRLEEIYLFPNLFVQAEHTAQVDKEIARTLQSDFKQHSINILACSTTMEMGVDLGNLEVVMLSSVPPLPANYKQRAGRSGRNNRIRSACITLCGSDVVGLRTLYSPLEKIIFRPVEVPTVDLMSSQVVQRHVNSFLVRAFGVFAGGNHGGSLNQKVVDYYSPYVIVVNSTDHRLEIMDTNGQPISPSQALGDKTSTRYTQFNNKCESAEEIAKVSVELGLLLRGTCFEGLIDTVIGNAKKENERCYAELAEKLDDYKFAYDNIGSEPKYEKFRNKLKMQYMEALNERLLNFWATNRFTPNANMPVNVLSLDLNSGRNAPYYSTTSSNPSYSLREAIAQYAPGNSIVVDGIVYIVRGIEYNNMYKAVNTFKNIYHNRYKTVIDNPTLPDRQRWEVNGRYDLELITPVAFSPDFNESYSRIIGDVNYTHVSAQLIGTSDWCEDPTAANLFSVRNNKDTGDAKILYYNEGVGYGYCFCTRCGRMVVEDEAPARSTGPTPLPPEMNNKFPKEPDKPKYHYAIGGRDIRKPCGGSYDQKLIRRHVIIGGLLQTDYSEIRLRNKKTEQWIGTRCNNEGLLYTLGIVFTQCLLEVLGKERGAVDFAITPDGHICIFDTNPGGSGYANQLIRPDLMMRVVTAAGKLLEEARKRNSNDMLLDKFTLRYQNNINVDIALNWIKSQETC